MRLIFSILWTLVLDWVGCECEGSSCVFDSTGSVDGGGGDVGVVVLVFFVVGHGDFGRHR